MVHHRDTNVTHADVTRRRGWPAIPSSWSALGSGRLLGRRLSSVPVAGGVEASPLPDIASVPPGQNPPDPGRGRRLHTGGSGTRKFDLPMGPLIKKLAGERLRRAGPPAAPAAGFLGYISGVSGPSSSPENLRLGTIKFAAQGVHEPFVLFFSLIDARNS